MDEFLKIEYEKCLDLIKYYDERHDSLVKFCAGLSSAVPSLLLSIFQLGNEVTVYFWKFAALISIISTIGLLSIFTVLVQTRLYFIYPARQVNAIRKHALQSQSVFTDNQMYLDTTFNAFKWSSSHTLQNGFVALQIGALSALSTYSICIYKSSNISCLFYLSVAVGLIVSLVAFAVSAWYLNTKSQYHPDRSIHGNRNN